jgi:hypothetical protein
MTTSRLDVLSPLFMGEDKIGVSLDPLNDPAFVERPITVNFDYTAAIADGGLVLPVVVSIQPPSTDGVAYIRKVFRRSLPSSFTFTAVGAGQHFILIKESGHNQWQGRLLFNVEGESFSQILINERV